MIHCILLAAGFGRRFDGDKLNAPVDGKPMYRHVTDRLEKLAAEGLCDLRIVTRRDTLSGTESLSGRTELLINERASEGVSSSIRCGLNALPDDGLPIAFFVADQPHLSETTIRGMLAAYPACGCGILRAACGTRVGNPVIFARKYEEELRELTGDCGGKAVILRHPDDVALYPVGGARELTDFDEGIGGRE